MECFQKQVVHKHVARKQNDGLLLLVSDLRVADSEMNIWKALHERIEITSSSSSAELVQRISPVQRSGNPTAGTGTGTAAATFRFTMQPLYKANTKNWDYYQLANDCNVIFTKERSNQIW